MARKNLDRFSQVKPTINFYSKKNQSLMFCESYVEVGALFEMEFDPTIARYVTQPTTYRLYREGRKTRYTPDALVKGIGGDFWYEEIKSEGKAKTQRFIRDHQFHSDELYYRTGVPLKLRISDAPHRCTFRQNLKYLYPFIDFGFDNSALALLKSVSESTRLGDLHSLFCKQGLDKRPVFAGLAQGLLAFDKMERVDDNLIVRVIA